MKEHSETLRQIHRRRLGILEEQAAHFGISTPPHILMEMEDIRSQLEITDEQLLDSDNVDTASSENQPTLILFLSAEPTDQACLRLGEEFREIKNELRYGVHRDRFQLALPQLSTRPGDVAQSLLDLEPNIIHFSGHGTGKGALCFENSLGTIHPIEVEALSALFKQFAHHIECVILNACYSVHQAMAIAQHINYVIGMNQAISDRAAIAFSIGFYQALGAGRTFKESYGLGCIQIRLHNIPEHLTPILIMNGEIYQADT